MLGAGVSRSGRFRRLFSLATRAAGAGKRCIRPPAPPPARALGGKGDGALEVARRAERLAGLRLERQLTGVRPGNLPVLVSGLVPESQEGELSSLGHDRGRGIVGGQKRVNR